MTDDAKDGGTRRRRRSSHYPARLVVYLPAPLRAALDRDAERDGVAVGVLAREALEAGWPRVQERHRKARRTGAGTGGRNGAAS